MTPIGERGQGEVLAELARMDDQALRWWTDTCTLHDAIEATYALLGLGVLVENEHGDNVSVSVPIDVWRQATAALHEALRIVDFGRTIANEEGS